MDKSTETKVGCGGGDGGTMTAWIGMEPPFAGRKVFWNEIEVNETAAPEFI